MAKPIAAPATEREAPTRTRDGEVLVKSVFGASMYQQGRGFYVPLEFFAMVEGAHRIGENVLPALGRSVRFGRRSHDFARRLLAGDEKTVAAIGDEATVRTLRALLRGLAVPVPGRRAETARWQSEHLYPYAGELVHYDAVERNEKPVVERYAYRGAGGLVHLIIRSDHDAARVSETRTALVRIFRESSTALARIARALSKRDSATPSASEPWADDLEGAETAILDTKWLELIRAGTHRLLVRGGVPDSKRIEALMHWLPFCIAMHQLDLARARCDVEAAAIPVDFRPGANPVRRLAREAFRESANVVMRALEQEAVLRNKLHLLKGSQKWRSGPRTFFGTTLGAVGALNAVTGERHFTFSTTLLDSIVLALLEREVEFDRFCFDILWKQLGFVVDGRSAADAGLLKQADRSEFEGNALHLASELRDLGLLQEFSDATRMVGAQLW